MFQRRKSRNGQYEYLIHVQPTQEGDERGKYVAKVAQVVERATGIALTQQSPVHEHRGFWPEDAVDRAFAEAEMILSQGAVERAPKPMVRQLGADRAPEWRALLAKPPSVLFEGAETLTDAFVNMLTPYLRPPIQWSQPGAALDLRDDQGSLVLREVAALDREQQSHLNRWLEDKSAPRQIVATTKTPLFTLVERGLFDPALYYRLNVVLLRL